jgi:branched-chain amino acid transport system permease protein
LFSLIFLYHRGRGMSLFDQILQYLIGGITKGSIYSIVALGFTIIYNSTEIINFAQGEFVMLGALTMVTFTTALHLPLPIAFLCAVASVTIIGMVFDLSIIRPAKKASPVTLIIITIGASIFIRGISMLAWGKDPYTLQSFSGDAPIQIGGASIIPQTLWIIGTTLIILAGLQLFFEYTITGKAMKACAINRRAASLLGIRVNRMILFSFALSGALGAVAGIIISPITFASYDMGVMLGLKGFCGAVIGGLGSVPGSIIGGFVLGILESLGAGLISSAYKDAIAFVILLLVLFIRPTGLLGSGNVKRV